MREWFESVAGPTYGWAVMWTLGALLLLAIVLVAVRLVRRLTFGTFVAGGRNRKARLAVMDAAPIDSQRRLVLVRRDDVEHLILIGGPTDVVVEQHIRHGVAVARAPADEAPRPLPASPPREQPPTPALQARAPARPEAPAQPVPANESPAAVSGASAAPETRAPTQPEPQKSTQPQAQARTPAAVETSGQAAPAASPEPVRPAAAVVPPVYSPQSQDPGAPSSWQPQARPRDAAWPHGAPPPAQAPAASPEPVRPAAAVVPSVYSPQSQGTGAPSSWQPQARPRDAALPHVAPSPARAPTAIETSRQAAPAASPEPVRPAAAVVPPVYSPQSQGTGAPSSWQPQARPRDAALPHVAPAPVESRRPPEPTPPPRPLRPAVEMDDRLMRDLADTLGEEPRAGPAPTLKQGPAVKESSLEDEMSKLLGELSSGKR